MIDLHAHLLPGLDDGAADWNETKAILQQAADAGIKTIAATSHYSPEADLKYDETLRDVSAKFPAVQLIQGMEYDYDRLIEIADGHYRCFGTSRYLLIDLKCSYIPAGMKQLLFSLRMRNYKILLAHPERLWAGNAAEVLKSVQNPDFFFQLNAGSVLGVYGRHVQKTAFYLIEHGRCHLFADDVHNSGGIFLKKCRELLAQIYPESLIIRWFEVNPQRLLDDLPLLKACPDQSFFARFSRWRKTAQTQKLTTM